MTEPRDPNLVDPYFRAPPDPETQTFPTTDYPPSYDPDYSQSEQRNSGVTYGRPSTYSPPHESRTGWAPAWTQGTPPHWLEPLPGQDRRRQSRGRSAMYVAALIFVALVAGAVGSAGDIPCARLRWRDNSGQQVAASLPRPAASAAPQPSSRTVILDEQSAITAAAEAVSPAVVTITVRGAKPRIPSHCLRRAWARGSSTTPPAGC